MSYLERLAVSEEVLEAAVASGRFSKLAPDNLDFHTLWFPERYYVLGRQDCMERIERSGLGPLIFDPHYLPEGMGIADAPAFLIFNPDDPTQSVASATRTVELTTKRVEDYRHPLTLDHPEFERTIKSLCAELTMIGATYLYCFVERRLQLHGLVPNYVSYAARVSRKKWTIQGKGVE